MKKVGITGAGGKIGTVLSEDLAEEFDFTLFDNQWDSKQPPPKNLKMVDVDFSRADEVEGVFEGLDVVIHLAASSHHDSSWEKVLPNNIIATKHVFDEALRAKVGRIVFASSNHVQMGYAMVDTPVSLSPFYLHHRGYIRLDDPPAPDSYYGISKLFGEELGWYYSKKFGIRFIALRIGATGPNDDLESTKGTEFEEYVRAMFLSRQDCAEAFRRAIEVDADFLIAYAISDNDRRLFDMKESMEKLQFYPRDNSEDFFRE